MSDFMLSSQTLVATATTVGVGGLVAWPLLFQSPDDPIILPWHQLDSLTLIDLAYQTMEETIFALPLAPLGEAFYLCGRPRCGAPDTVQPGQHQVDRSIQVF